MERSDAPAGEVQKQLGLWFVVGEITDKQRSPIVVARTIRRLPASEREDSHLGGCHMRGTPVAGRAADAVAGYAPTVTRHAVEQREVIVVPASSGAPLQAGSGEGVSAPSNPVPNLPKPTVARARHRLQWKASIIQVERELTVLVLVVTCLWRWHKPWIRQRNHTRRRGPKRVWARFVVNQFATSLDANFPSPTPGLEVTRVLLALALSKNLTILLGDVSVAFMNRPMPEGDPVYVEPPEGLYEHNDTVRCPRRALNGLRDASRLFHEHFTAVLTSRLGFTRSEALPTLFVDLARNVFIAVHVDDLIMVGSGSQLSEVVGEMKQYFTMKVTHPLSASSTQTYVGVRYLRHADAIWELPTARYVTGMLIPTRHAECKTCGQSCCESQR